MTEVSTVRRLAQHGEDYLDGVAAIQLVLEDGRHVSFEIGKELAVPHEPKALWRESLRAPARMAFFAYQEERALAQLRTHERMFAKVSAEEYLIARTFISEHTDTDMVTEGHVRARMDTARRLNAEKKRVAESQRRYGVLRALRVALEHRSHLLRKLVSQEIEGG